jgi:hypothetical protein
MGVNGTVQLHCKAHVAPVGGYRILLGPVVDSEIQLRYGSKESWQLYMVHWEYHYFGDTQYVQINCSLNSGLGTNCTSNSVEGGLLTSVLATNISGSYRCFVYDWDENLKYTSQYIQVLGDENSTASINHNSTYATKYIGNETSTVSKPEMLCEDGGDGGYYQWFRNGSPLKSHNSRSKLEANDFGVYVCYTYFYNRTTVAYSTYRVLPFGCINPVTNLDYPILEDDEDASSSIATKLKFCWNQPTHLGGLQSGNISYNIKLGTISGAVNKTYLLNSDGKHCYKAKFPSRCVLFRGINISITAFAQGRPSLSTQFPDTNLFSWYKLRVKKYCSDYKMTLSVSDPVPNFGHMEVMSLKQTRLNMDEPVPPKLDNTYLTFNNLCSRSGPTIEIYHKSSDRQSFYTFYDPPNGHFKNFTLDSNAMLLVVFCKEVDLFDTKCKLPVSSPIAFSQQPVIYTCDIPKAPGEFYSISTTHQSITLQWSEPTPRYRYVPAIEKYTIEQIDKDGQITTKTIGNRLQYTFDDLAPSTNYTFRLYAINGDGRGFPSKFLNVFTKDYFPSHPQNVTVKTISGRSMIVSWVHPKVKNGEISLYEVKVVGVGAVATQKTEVTPNTSIVINDLVMCMRYNVTVRASTTAGYGNASHPIVSGPGSLLSCNSGIVAVIGILCVALALLSSVLCILVTLGIIQWIRRRQYKMTMRKTLTLETQPRKDAGMSCMQSDFGDEITQYEYEFEQVVSSNSNYITQEVALGGKSDFKADVSSMQGISVMHSTTNGYIDEVPFMNQIHGYIIRSCKEEDA